MLQNKEIKSVTIPLCNHHGGMPWNFGIVKLYWVCPKCGRRRNDVRKVLSYDGSAYYSCDGWSRCECGNVDYYEDLRKEAAENGLNNDVEERIKENLELADYEKQLKLF